MKNVQKGKFGISEEISLLIGQTVFTVKPALPASCELRLVCSIRLGGRTTNSLQCCFSSYYNDWGLGRESMEGPDLPFPLFLDPFISFPYVFVPNLPFSFWRAKSPFPYDFSLIQYPLLNKTNY